MIEQLLSDCSPNAASRSGDQRGLARQVERAATHSRISQLVGALLVKPMTSLTTHRLTARLLQWSTSTLFLRAQPPVAYLIGTLARALPRGAEPSRTGRRLAIISQKSYDVRGVDPSSDQQIGGTGGRGLPPWRRSPKAPRQSVHAVLPHTAYRHRSPSGMRLDPDRSGQSHRPRFDLRAS